MSVVLDELGAIGFDLAQPECVVASIDGSVHVSDGRGGVTEIRADGSQMTLLAKSAELSGKLSPNGIFLERDGSYLIAHLSMTEGGVFNLHADGRLTPFVREADGVELPPTNYVCRDRRGRVWITVSTRSVPRSLDYKPSAATGFIALHDGKSTRIVADGLGYANECGVSPDGSWLYVNETFAKRLSRLPLRADGSLGSRETVCTFGAGEFPDGLAFDADGCVWVACIFANRIIRVSPDGSTQTWVDGGDLPFIDKVERAFQGALLTRSHMTGPTGSPLGNVSSITFGGVDMRTAYLGSLQGTSVRTFRAPARGYAR